MMDVCMPVVKVSQGDFKVVYAREILCWSHEFSPQASIYTSDCHEICSINISKNCINLKSGLFL